MTGVSKSTYLRLIGNQVRWERLLSFPICELAKVEGSVIAILVTYHGMPRKLLTL
jgi:hypothetical protein